MTLVGEFEQKDKYDYKNGDQRQEQEQELSEAGSVNMLNIEFSGYDTIRVSEAPTVIITALRLAILKYWTQGYVFIFLLALFVLLCSTYQPKEKGQNGCGQITNHSSILFYDNQNREGRRQEGYSRVHIDRMPIPDMGSRDDHRGLDGIHPSIGEHAAARV